jgi:putative aldouronate transport system substrate-binding protein
MKLFRRIVLTGAALALTLTVTGCGGKKNTGADGKPVLTIGIQTMPNITDYETNYFTQYMEKFNNVNLDFYLLPNTGVDIRAKISLMVASDDLPDIFITTALSTEAILDYGSKGAFIPLNKYINNPAASPYFSAIPDGDKGIMVTSMTAADGNIYSVASYGPETWNLTPNRLYLNQAWVNKLGLKMPVTTEDLRNVLIAFRDRDPNGNGKKDEIPLYGFFDGGYGENTIITLINSFVFYNEERLALDASGNNVTAPFVDPAFRKALIYINGLFKDGLMAPSLFTDDEQQFRAAMNLSPSIVGLSGSGSLSTWTNVDTNANFWEMTMIPPPVGPDGVGYSPYTGINPSQIAFITSKCKNPDLAWKFLDSFYEGDITIISRFGEEGVDWSRKPEDLAKDTNAYVEMGMYPKLSIVESSSIWNEPNNQYWRNINPRYAPLSLGNTRGSLTSPYNPKSAAALVNRQNYEYNVEKHPAHILPVLKYTAAESEKNSEAITNVNAYVRQSIAEFVISTRDINSDTAWNAYLRELDNMGLQQWLSTSQAAYNRTKK